MNAQRWHDRISPNAWALIAALVVVVSGWSFIYLLGVIASRIS